MCNPQGIVGGVVLGTILAFPFAFAVLYRRLHGAERFGVFVKIIDGFPELLPV